MASEAARELHNRLAGPIVASIVKPIVEVGGSYIDVMVLLESIVAGTLHVCVKMGADEAVLDKLTEGVRLRMAELRLGGITPAGGA